MRHQKPDSNVQRLSGFTLVELLVVIVILSILSALSLAGIQSARARGRIAKTQSTIRKLTEVILPYYELYETRRPDVPRAVEQIKNRNVVLEANRIALRRLMTMELPERQTDITNIFASDGVCMPGEHLIPNTSSIPDIESRKLKEVSPVARRYNSLIQGKKVDSGDLLHLIIMRGIAADPDLISNFRQDEIRDTNGNGLPEFVDGWNKPIKFKRWPVGFVSPFQPINGRLSLIDERVSRDGHRLVPLIYSAGPDQEYDINDIDLNYRSVDYDPFAVQVVQNEAPSGAAREVVLYQVTHDDADPNTYDPVTYIAERADDNGSTNKPDDLVEESGSVSSTPRQTVASERGPAAGVYVRSRDNINNHDMTR